MIGKFAGIVELAASPSIGSVLPLGGAFYVVAAATGLDDADTYEVTLVGPFADQACGRLGNGEIGPRIEVKASDRIDLAKDLGAEPAALACIAETARSA